VGVLSVGKLGGEGDPFEVTAYTWAFMRMRDVAVVAMLFMVPIEVSDSLDPVLERRVFLDDGDSETFAIGTNTPYLGLHSKYLQWGWISALGSH